VPAMGSGDSAQLLVGPTNMVVRRGGWLYVYVSNESNQNVFFDNIVVSHKRGPVVEQSDYYAFGLEIPGLTSHANTGTAYANNRYKANGANEYASKEFKDGSGLELYDAGFRGYDAQTGRFTQQDPLTEIDPDWSPFAYVHDNPIAFSDPLGLSDSTRPKAAANFDHPDTAFVTPSSAAEANNDESKNAPTYVNPNTAQPNQPNNNPNSNTSNSNEPDEDSRFLSRLNELKYPIRAGTLATVLSVVPWKGGPDFEGHSEMYYLNFVNNYAKNFPQLAPAPSPLIHPFASDRFVGHGNQNDNSNPHIVYQFTFTPLDGKTPVIKYGISDVTRWGMNRVYKQLVLYRLMFNQSVDFKILTRTHDRAHVKFIEQLKVSQHVAQWKEMPRDQINPGTFDWF